VQYSLLITAKTLAASQEIIALISADTETAPDQGAQVIPMAPNSQGCIHDAVKVDRHDCWLGQSPVGCSPRGLVLFLMLVSFLLWWSYAEVCVLCAWYF
jgi:hypothetical protein